MEINTKDNKKIDVPEDRILTIPEGLLGFEEYTKYALKYSFLGDIVSLVKLMHVFVCM